MTHSNDPEKAVDGIVGGSAPDMLKTKYGVGDGEDPEITSSTTDGTNNRLMRLKDEYGSTWASPTDPSDPYNWQTSRKFTMGVIFSFGQLIPIMSASMIAPSLPAIASDLAISASTAQITMSVYFLGMGIAPFLIASASEIWGRKPVWLICNAWYVAWNTLCPVGRNTGLMIVGRFMTGAGASVGVTLNGPVMADMYGENERGKSLAMVTLLPFLGPALGPIVGGLVTHSIHWSWVFWIMSAFNAVVLIVGFFVIRESYTPVLLRRKALAEGANVLTVKAERARIAQNLLRPIRIFITRPITWLISLTATLSFAVYTLMLATYASLWIDKYGQSELVSSLHYLSIATGSTLCGQLGGRIMDWSYRKQAKRTGGKGVPEFRIPYMVPGMIIMPAGLFWYGWSAERTLHWVIVDFGVAIFTLGSFIVNQASIAYQIEEFGQFAASSGAAIRSVSYGLAFVFPIFAPDMYKSLGYGWGNSTLGLVSIGLGFPACAVLWFWGGRIRAVGKSS
ncbi:major facilitator superfamily domain-containing protein [Alternaria rosae]|uniref:major facilitator superfamily domain-containing protein n=1 Tax=Alternaria rosae TaxID=1187941 RepID=UPI001E8E5B33|nr:major facilitator superfamily domain-containing protein [Alternaria rosae]KAH6870425.1 major facilitator superfamily domain-containing protein [Alternaria rosae]